jgi:hypothetical protein
MSAMAGPGADSGGLLASAAGLRVCLLPMSSLSEYDEAQRAYAREVGDFFRNGESAIGGFVFDRWTGEPGLVQDEVLEHDVLTGFVVKWGSGKTGPVRLAALQKRLGR